MYVELDPAGVLRLADPRNMRAFHACVPTGQLARFGERLGADGRLEGSSHVWLSPSLIQTLAGPEADEDWRNNFAQMLAYARAKGWLDASGWIRAHIEFPPEPPARISTEAFKSLMRRCPASIAIIATGQGAGRVGLTVSSVASVCADPPTLSVCIHRTSSAYGALSTAPHIAFSFLSAGQNEIAMRFAGADGCRGSERFTHGEWREGTLGQPILAGAAGVCECEIVQRIDIGSHTMLIAEVVAAESSTSAPIINFEGRFLPVQ